MSSKCPYCKVYVDDDASVCSGCGAEAVYVDGTGWIPYLIICALCALFAFGFDTWWSWLLGILFAMGGFSAAGQQKKWER